MGCPRCGGLDPAYRGFSTTLKPAFEPIVLARKPLVGTVAGNVLAHGTGALNIDACRVGSPEDKKHPGTRAYQRFDPGSPSKETQAVQPYTKGRWPANVILDEEAAALLDAQSGALASGSRAEGVRTGMGYHGANGDGGPAIVGDVGGASRFFYTAKASKADRGEWALPDRRVARLRKDLTDDERAYVMAELRKAGVDGS